MAHPIYAVLLLMAAIAESTLGYRLDALGGGRLNLVLVMVAVWSLTRGARAGLVAGLFGGLALDVMSATPFGLYTLLLGLIGVSTASFGGTLSRGGLALVFGTAVLTTAAYHGVTVLVLRVLGWDWPGLIRFVNVLVPTIALNWLAMPLVAGLARRIDRTFASWQRLELE